MGSQVWSNTSINRAFTTEWLKFHGLELVTVRIYLEFTAVIVALESNKVRETADGTALVLPEFEVVGPLKMYILTNAYQVAAVTRGILSSGGIAVSSIDILDR